MRDNRNKLRKFVEKEHILWYPRKGGVYFEDVNGEDEVKENIHKIFQNWNETIIWSCLQGIMGEIHTNSSEDAAMAILYFLLEIQMKK